MTEKKEVKYLIKRSFDTKSNRHSINDIFHVLHCHHYMVLYCQLAEDAEHFNGIKLIKDAIEETYYPILTSYFEEHKVTELKDRVIIAEEIWKNAGMGTVAFTKIGEFSATAEMEHSHVDEGWIQKFGKRDKPVNFVSQAYVQTAVAAINNLPMKSFKAIEIQSIVAGADKSIFNIVKI